MADTSVSKVQTWVLNNLDLVSSALRFIKPIVVVGGNALITRFYDVQDVLSRNSDFHVPYTEKMEKVTNGSNFFLGMQNTPTYERDVSNIRLVARREDLNEKIKPFMEKQTQETVKGLNTKFDLIQDYSLRISTDFVGYYFGTPGWESKDLDFSWNISQLFEYLFYGGDPKFDEKSLESAAKVRTYLDETIALRNKNRSNKDDVISRCFEMQDAKLPGMTDLDIRNNLIGLIIGAIPTNSKCVALTIDYLLDHPKLLAQAQQAAKEDNDALLIQFVLESIRLNPFAAGIKRICATSCKVGRGYWRSTTIPKGTTVLALTQSAMRDGRVFKSPSSFRLDRPVQNYMHFGYSLHTCFGQYMNLVTIPEMVKVLLKLKGLKRAAGEEGKMKMKGPFPSQLILEYEV